MHCKHLWKKCDELSLTTPSDKQAASSTGDNGWLLMGVSRRHFCVYVCVAVFRCYK